MTILARKSREKSDERGQETVRQDADWKERGLLGGRVAVEDAEEAGHGAPGEAVGGDAVGVAGVGEEVLREGGCDFVGMKRADSTGRAEAEGVPEGVAAGGVFGGGDGAGVGLFDGGDDLGDAVVVHEGQDEEEEFVGGVEAGEAFVGSDEVFEDARGPVLDEELKHGSGGVSSAEGCQHAKTGEVVVFEGVFRDVAGDGPGAENHFGLVGKDKLLQGD